MKFAFIKEHQDQFDIGVMCAVHGVSRSGYYAWLKRKPSARQQHREELFQHVAEVFDDHRGVYGSPRVFKALDQAGVACCENTVAKLMRENGLFSCIKRKFRVMTTDSDHDHPVAPNRLDRRFEWDAPDQAWATDITYLATGQGWLYLAVVIDLCSRTIVGWAAANHLRAELCTEALENAIQTRRPAAGLLHHSDRGVQYACMAYQGLLAKHEMVCSMSRRGNCWDNAAAESFFKSLKAELAYQTQWATHAEARDALFEWIEVFYNRKRLHSTLGYVSPATYEAQFN